MNAPLVLAFDTSAANCSVAVLRGHEVLASHDKAMPKGQAEQLMPICLDMLETAGIETKDLSAIGVGVGPGNFTGIRISVAAARGLSLGLGVPAIGVTAFEALRDGIVGPCACAVDARRDTVYLQAFDAEGPKGTPVMAPSATLPAFEGPLIGHGGARARHTNAVAIARVAQSRLGSVIPRPAPLYLKPADAAPARDAAPTILP